jgi:hypothetical protein
MSLRRFAFVVGFLVICCLLFSQSRATSATSPATVPIGFQLLPAEVSMRGGGNNWDEHRVYLLDSASGRVWELVPENIGKDGKYHEAWFQSVAVMPKPVKE